MRSSHGFRNMKSVIRRLKEHHQPAELCSNGAKQYGPSREAGLAAKGVNCAQQARCTSPGSPRWATIQNFWCSPTPSRQGCGPPQSDASSCPAGAMAALPRSAEEVDTAACGCGVPWRLVVST